MKISNYNFFTACNIKQGSFIIHNPITSSTMIIPENEAEALQKNDLSELTSTKLEKFVQKGFVIDDDFSELDVLKLRNMTSKTTQIAYSLTIALTYLCNFKCPYCYQGIFENLNNDPTIISQEIQDSIVTLVNRKILEGARRISITWYGGEPLLAPNAIEYISKKVIELCEEKKVEYTASIITNGYLLNENIAQMLKKSKVTSAQITLDGLASTHDTRRILKGGQPTFDKIIENIELYNSSFKQISIRVNVDSETSGATTKIARYIKEIMPEVNNVRVYPALVCGGSDSGGVLSNETFQIEKNSFYEEHPNVPELPIKRGTYCCIDNANSDVIDCYGNIFKCWEYLSEKNIVGKLRQNGVIHYNKKFYEFALYDPTEDELCNQCKFLPLCMGGCQPNRKRGVTCDMKLISEKEINRILNAWALKVLFSSYKQK